MTSDLLSVQTEQDEMTQVVSGHQHLPAHGYVHAAVPETGREGALKKKKIMAFKKVILHTAVLDNCRASVCFTVLSPNVVVIVATVLNRGHDGGRPALKALQGQRALARGHVDSGEVRRAELHAADEVSRSVLRTGTQRQDKKVPSDKKIC